MTIVMTNQAHLQPFIGFLQHQTEYKFINNDQWMGFYRFSLEVIPYNPSSCQALLPKCTYAAPVLQVTSTLARMAPAAASYMLHLCII